MFDLKLPTHRRGFLGNLAASAAGLGLGSLVPRGLVAQPVPAGSQVDDPQLDAAAVDVEHLAGEVEAGNVAALERLELHVIELDPAPGGFGTRQHGGTAG